MCTEVHAYAVYSVYYIVLWLTNVNITPLYLLIIFYGFSIVSSS